MATRAGHEVDFSVVICSIDAAKYRRVHANYSQLLRDRKFEVIGIHDARSLAEGYTRGVRASSGRTIVLSHDDIEILTPDFADRVTRHLATLDLIGIAGTSRLVSGKWNDAGDPYRFALVTSPEKDTGVLVTALIGGVGIVVPGMQALDGVFWAMRRDVAESVDFDEATFDHFHLYDLDFTFRAFLAGYRLAVCRDLVIIHESTGNFDETWLLYKHRFERKFADRLAVVSPAVQGAIATFRSTNREEILKLCSEARLEGVIGRIETMNAQR